MGAMGIATYTSRKPTAKGRCEVTCPAKASGSPRLMGRNYHRSSLAEIVVAAAFGGLLVIPLALLALELFGVVDSLVGLLAASFQQVLLVWWWWARAHGIRPWYRPEAAWSRF